MSALGGMALLFKTETDISAVKYSQQRRQVSTDISAVSVNQQTDV